MIAYLVEVETKEESEWLAATFIMKGKLSLCLCSIVYKIDNKTNGWVIRSLIR